MTTSLTRHSPASRPLAVLGISKDADQVYGALVDEPGSSASQLAHRAGLTVARGKDALAELETRGLATRAASRPPRYFPTAPELALGTLIRQREQDLAEVRAAAADYQTRYLQTAGSQDPLDLVEVVLGRAAVLQRVTQLQRAAQDEILVLDTPPYAATEEVVDAEVEHLERGVRARVIYARSALEVPGQLEVIRRLSDLGEDSRIRDELPTKMMIADRRHAIVPLGFERPGIDGIAVIHASPLLGALIALFESLWVAATPVALGPSRAPAVVDADERDLLTLLAAGLKDDAIARHIGVSRRTVQRRIHTLMRKVDAQSRSQITLQAARLDLLPLTPGPTL